MLLTPFWGQWIGTHYSDIIPGPTPCGQNLKGIIWPLIDQFVPKKLVNHTQKFKVRNFTKNIRNLLPKKADIWRLLRNDKSNSILLQKNRDIANKCEAVIFTFDLENEKTILEKNNLSSFYKYINRKLSSPSGVAPLSDTIHHSVYLRPSHELKLCSSSNLHYALKRTIVCWFRPSTSDSAGSHPLSQSTL